MLEVSTSETGRFQDDAVFRRTVEDLMGVLLDQVDEIDFDLDPGMSPGNLQVVFEDDGSTFVLSQQTPTHELWLSANFTAWHFRRIDGVWSERDTGEPMLAILGDLFSRKVGETITFAL
jgi:iron donor protein CyaY